jgi:hypothetical protein
MVKSRSKESERVCRKGEEDDECSTIIGGYVVKTLEALVWQWEEEKEEKEEEFLYKKAACNKINKGLSKK